MRKQFKPSSPLAKEWVRFQELLAQHRQHKQRRVLGGSEEDEKRIIEALEKNASVYVRRTGDGE